MPHTGGCYSYRWQAMETEVPRNGPCPASHKIRGMMRAWCGWLVVLSSAALSAQGGPQAATISYDVAYAHELPPHRRSIPLAGVREGFNQIGLTLTVSAAGDVVGAYANTDQETEQFWPLIRAEVLGWKFKPFLVDGQPVTAQVEEYVDLAPPERFPTKHVQPPALRPDSKIVIELTRSGCYGRCPAYEVTVTNRRVSFVGEAFVNAKGKHGASVDPEAVRKLAQKFIDADFYSMDDKYAAGVTDNPTYTVSISIDGRTKKVVDYVGTWVGMPAAIRQLEDDVDQLAHTEQWIR